MKHLKLCVYYHNHFENWIYKVSTNVEKCKFGCFAVDKKKYFFLNLNYFIFLRFQNICLESNKLVWFT